MTSLILMLRTETIKVKNSFAVWLVIFGAALIPVFFIIHHFYKWREYLPGPGENPWNDYFRKGFNGIHFTFLPLLIVLLIALLFNIEHKSNTWKHIFVLPVSKSKIFLSKYLLLMGLVLLFYGLMLVFLLSGGLALSLWKGEFNFLEYPPSYMYARVQSGIAAYLVKSFIATLAIVAIHFWLSFRLKNLFLNIGIALAGVVIAVSIYIPHWESIIYLPYAFPVLMCNFIPDSHHFLSDFHINSLIYFAVISLLSYLDFVWYFKGY